MLINKSGSNLARSLLVSKGLFLSKVFETIKPVLKEDNNCVCIQPDKLLLVLTFLQLLNSAIISTGYPFWLISDFIGNSFPGPVLTYVNDFFKEAILGTFKPLPFIDFFEFSVSESVGWEKKIKLIKRKIVIKNRNLQSLRNIKNFNIGFCRSNGMTVCDLEKCNK